MLNHLIVWKLKNGMSDDAAVVYKFIEDNSFKIYLGSVNIIVQKILDSSKSDYTNLYGKMSAATEVKVDSLLKLVSSDMISKVVFSSEYYEDSKYFSRLSLSFFNSFLTLCRILKDFESSKMIVARMKQLNISLDAASYHLLNI